MHVSKWTGAMALCAGLAFGGTAQAAEEGWYVVGFGGQASTKNVNQGELDQNLVDFFGSGGLTVVDATSNLDDSDTGFGLADGYQVNRNFATELAYVDLGEFSYGADGTVTDGVTDYAAGFGLSQSAAGPRRRVQPEPSLRRAPRVEPLRESRLRGPDGRHRHRPDFARPPLQLRLSPGIPPRIRTGG